MNEIPLSGYPETFSISLGGTTYQLTVRYFNTWVLDLYDVSQTPLALGVPLVTGVSLLSQLSEVDIGGDLVVLSTPDSFKTPTETDLGTTTRLFYV